MSVLPPNSPPWLKIAFRYEGQSEVKGPKTAPFIAKWLHRIGSFIQNDEDPWCGTTIAGCLAESNDEFGTKLTWPKYHMRALAYADYGLKLNVSQFRPGAICVKQRKDAKGKVVGGHVFFYVYETDTHVWGMGGNTGDMMKLAPYKKSDIIAVVWPAGATLVPGDFRNFGGSVKVVLNSDNKED